MSQTPSQSEKRPANDAGGDARAPADRPEGDTPAAPRSPHEDAGRGGSPGEDPLDADLPVGGPSVGP